jgi:secretion/DNA translocation related TadE-like protein
VSVAVWSLLPVCAAILVLALGAAVGTRHRAAVAADAAALAAAARADLGVEEACAAARQIAGAQGADLTACAITSGFADVTAETRPPPMLEPFGGRSRVQARAGPR